MNKTRATLLVIASLSAIGGSFAWVRSQTAAPIAVRHFASLPANRHRPAISGMHGMVVKLTQQLGLTAPQEAQTSKILDAMQPRMAAIHANKSLSPQNKQAAVAKEMNTAAAQLSQILNQSQKLKFNEMMEQMRAQHAGH